MDMSQRSEPIRAVLYCRYSSHAQREVSIDQQVKECQKFAEAKGIEIIKIYDDRAVSGTSDRRPKFQLMISEAERMDYQYVIVYSLDRFARDRYDSAVYKRQLKALGKRVLSATEHISDDPTGILIESLLEGMAEYYSKELSRKIRRGMNDNAEKCLANGKRPYGYAKGPDGRLVIVEHEANTVREIFSRVNAGENFADIYRDLNYRGIKTRSGVPWSNSSFYTMLKNERYVGVYSYGNVRIEGGMPAIVDRELFDAVQYRLRTKKNPRAPQRRRRDNGTYLLTGKIFCGECLSPMVGVSGTGKHGELHYYYTCKGRREKNGCGRRPLRRDTIEDDVANAIRKYVLTDETIFALADAVVARQAAAKKDPIIAVHRAELAEVQKSIKNIVAAIEQGIVSKATQQRLTELEKQEQELLERVASDEYMLNKKFTWEAVIAMLKLFQEGTFNDKDFQKVMFDSFLIAVYVYDDKLRIKFSFGDKCDEDIDFTPAPDLPDEADPAPVSGVRISTTLAHHSPLYEHMGRIIAIANGVYMVTCGL